MTIRSFSQYRKTVCMKKCKKKHQKPHRIYLKTEENQNNAVRKQFLFLCKVARFKVGCYTQASVVCKNRHHVIGCLAHGGEYKFSKIVMTKKSITWRLVWLCKVRMLTKYFFFQHQFCFFALGDDHLQKMASCNFYLNTWRQIKFQRNCNDKKIPTTLRLVGLCQVET